MGRVTTPEVRTGQGTLEDFLDGSGDPLGGPGWVVGPSLRSWKGGGTIGDFLDGLGDPQRAPGGAGDPREFLNESGRSGRGRGPSGDPRRGPERVGGNSGCSGRVDGHLRCSGTDQGTLGEVQDGS